MAEAAHRVNPAANPILRLYHLHARAVGFEVKRGGKPGEPGPDDDNIAPVAAARARGQGLGPPGSRPLRKLRRRKLDAAIPLDGRLRRISSHV